ncbi:MAG: preprotein translocase subunit SecA, partial [Pseudonocardiales bacterium]|nr:preprotein translocase subunit SecA [Pseudonocardiales bacterium]
VLLSVLDRKWREHLYEMDYLQEGIGLRAMAQRDPLVEYQREGFDMFGAMMEAIKEESVGFLFNLEVQVEDQGTDGQVEPAPDQPRVDIAVLESVPAEPDTGNGHVPSIKAKGLDRDHTEKPLVYSAPDLGSDAPAVQTTKPDKPAGTDSPTARRQQTRGSNPNRGSRGNRSSKRKR